MIREERFLIYNTFCPASKADIKAARLRLKTYGEMKGEKQETKEFLYMQRLAHELEVAM